MIQVFVNNNLDENIVVLSLKEEGKVIPLYFAPSHARALAAALIRNADILEGIIEVPTEDVGELY